MNKFEKHVKIWAWMGRVLPLTALFALILVLIFDIANFYDWVLLIIAVGFGVTAFTWWWWVIYAVKSLTDMLEDNRLKFLQVVKELKTIRRDLKQERNK